MKKYMMVAFLGDTQIVKFYDRNSENDAIHDGRAVAKLGGYAEVYWRQIDLDYDNYRRIYRFGHMEGVE